MEANNSEVTEQTNQEKATDTSSTTEVSSIEAGDTATGEQSSSVESTDQEASVEESIYQIGDKEITLSRLAELEKGELLQSDYTKKSQLNAQSKKDLEAKHVLADEYAKRLSDTITKLEESIKAESDSEELEELRDTDMAEWSRRKEALAAKSEQAKKAKKELEAKQAEETQERSLVERELLISSNPKWVDQKVMDADIALIENFVTKMELTDKDFNSLGSHKLINMALSAAKYDQLQSSAEETEKQIQKAPNVIKATVKQTKPKGKRSLYG